MTGIDINDSVTFTIEGRCNTPAPLVVNGSAYVGCELPLGHEGPHTVTCKWDVPERMPPGFWGASPQPINRGQPE